MGVTIRLVQVSTQTLDLLQRDDLLIDVFFEMEYVTDIEDIEQSVDSISHPAHRSKYDWRSLGEQFLEDWELPELDLHKYFTELTFLLAGCAPDYPDYGPDYSEYEGQSWDQPEIKDLEPQGTGMLPFLVIPDSQWDGRPLVNAIFAGTTFEGGGDESPCAWYLLPDEVGQLLDGLIELGETGFQERYRRESQRSQPCPWIDWSEEEMLQWLTDYYNDMVHYFQDATRNKKAILVDLSV